jgi:hypothetical protein
MSEFTNKLAELEAQQSIIKARASELTDRINKIELEKVLIQTVLFLIFIFNFSIII